MLRTYHCLLLAVCTDGASKTSSEKGNSLYQQHAIDSPRPLPLSLSLPAGSKNQWDFESDAYKSTTCTIHTFDCTIETGNMPAHIRDRVTFHKICMGNSENNSKGKIFMSLKEIMNMLGHSYVTLLKVRRKRGKKRRKEERGFASLFENGCSLIHSFTPGLFSPSLSSLSSLHTPSPPLGRHRGLRIRPFQRALDRGRSGTSRANLVRITLQGRR